MASHQPSPTRRLAPYAFLTPAVVLFALFFALPIGYAIYLSFRAVHVKGLGLGAHARTEIWAGLSNYTSALADPELLAGAGRTLLYGALLVPTMLGAALFLALLLDTPRVRLGALSRLAIFLPYAVPGIVASLLWGFLYLPTVSPGYFLLDKAGIGGPDLLHGNGLFVALANIAVWGGTGFNMIVIYTSLRAIPAELYEAARLDGASELQVALRVKIPMVAPSLVLTFFFSMIATLQADDAQTADQLHEFHLESADEGLPRRLRPGRHPLRRRHLGGRRRGHPRPVLRLPQAGQQALRRRQLR
jgi:multiple sugar transport system permease protein